jgi:hypothetical protein
VSIKVTEKNEISKSVGKQPRVVLLTLKGFCFAIYGHRIKEKERIGV